jgi:hypothetical protein
MACLPHAVRAQAVFADDFASETAASTRARSTLFSAAPPPTPPHMQRLTPIPQEYCGGRRRVLSNLCPRCHPCYNSKPHLICGTCFQETSALLPHCIAFCRIKLADLWLNVLTRVVAARASEEAMTELAGKEVRSLLAPSPSFANASSPFLPPPPSRPCLFKRRASPAISQWQRHSPLVLPCCCSRARLSRFSLHLQHVRCDKRQHQVTRTPNPFHFLLLRDPSPAFGAARTATPKQRSACAGHPPHAALFTSLRWPTRPLHSFSLCPLLTGNPLSFLAAPPSPARHPPP